MKKTKIIDNNHNERARLKCATVPNNQLFQKYHVATTFCQ